MHYVILGAGPAGVIAAETLRKADAACDITLIGGEPEPPYSRMAIPYLLAREIDEVGTHLRHSTGHYKDLNIRYIVDRATGLSAKKKKLQLKDGGKISYDRLLISTGATPVRPEVEGLDLPGIHHCWTLEDARSIAALVKTGDPVVLMGAGFIGSIILEALVKMGVELTVVEMGDRMVPRMMDEVAGNMLKRWCEGKGVRVLTGTRIISITPAPAATDRATGNSSPDNSGRFLQWLVGDPNRPVDPSSLGAEDKTPEISDLLAVHLDNDESLPARLVVVAAGVRPNIDFLKGCGVETDQGIIVDEFLRSNLPDIYAAGDVAEAVDLATGKHEVLAIQPVAVEHGRIAALNMMGRETVHRGSLNMNVLATLGLISTSFGSWMGVDGGDSTRMVDEDNHRYIRLEFSGDRLVGMQSVGDIEHIGVARGLIQTGLRLGDWKEKLIRSPGRLPEAYLAAALGAPPG